MRRSGTRPELAEGFTLIEILIYTALIGIAGVFLNSTLVSVLRLQGQQDASTEVNQQINFVLQNIQKSVRDSSLIDMAGNVASSTLTLRMTDTALDPTLIYLSGKTVYIKKGTANPLALTTADVNADQLNFTKVSSYPGHDSVSVDLSFSFNTSNPQKTFSKTINSAISRVSGATFDSDILPGADATYSVGSVANRWQNLNLSGDLTVAGASSFTGNVGIGTAIPAVRLEVNGNAVYSNGNEAQLRISGTTDSNKRLNLGFDTTSDFGWIQPTKFGTGYKNLSLVPAGGNVGIGTTTPGTNYRLDVYDSGGSLKIGNSAPSSAFTIDTGLDSYLNINTGGSNAIRISANGGNVGIGTTSPSQKLSVTGTIYSNTGYRFPDGTTQTTAGGGGGSVQAPTRQVFLSGSGTYTTPAGVGFIRIRMVGGGGGSGGTHTGATAGGTGGTTSFNSVTAVGGGGGDTTGIGGAGGSGGIGSVSVRISGSTAVLSTGQPTAGASSPFGGAGKGMKYGNAGDPVGNASSNSGSGAGGNACNGCTPGYSGAGGAGEYVELLINSPGATYSYAVGAGGTAGAGQFVGATGGSGVIIVDEYYTTAFVASSAVSVPSRQILTSGSGTYTRPANVGQIRVRMVGGGGGGASTYALVAGSAGANTSFNSIVANAGSGGSGYIGGAGGSGGSGTASIRISGGAGSYNSIGGAYQYTGGMGGSSAFGGAGQGGPYTGAYTNGGAAAANSGSGGGGGGVYGSGGQASAGGGAGEYVELIINNPGATYSYTVGAGGAGAVTAQGSGGAGGSGIIIVDEFYSTVMSTDVSSAGTNTFTGANSFTGGLTTTGLTVNGTDVMGGWQSFTPTLSGNASMTVSAGTILTARYKIMGRTMFLNLYIYNITIGGTPSSDLQMLLPEGKVLDGGSAMAARLMDNNIWQVGLFGGATGSNLVYFNKMDASNWTAGSNTRFTLNAAIPIQ